MSQSLNLKELERVAFRRTFQDGLLDIYLGGLFASFTAFGIRVFPGSETASLTSLLYYLIGSVVSGLIFVLGKQFITLPRIGLVKFGPARRKRKRDLLLALGVIVAVQAVFVVLQFSALLSPPAREWLATVLGEANSSNLLVAFIAVLFVTPGMLLIAYKIDYPRLYYHAVIMALGVFLMILLDSAWWMVFGGVLIVVPGLVQFVRFLHLYPLQKIPDEHL